MEVDPTYVLGGTVMEVQDLRLGVFVYELVIRSMQLMENINNKVDGPTSTLRIAELYRLTNPRVAWNDFYLYDRPAPKQWQTDDGVIYKLEETVEQDNMIIYKYYEEEI